MQIQGMYLVTAATNRETVSMEITELGGEIVDYIGNDQLRVKYDKNPAILGNLNGVKDVTPVEDSEDD